MLIVREKAIETESLAKCWIQTAAHARHIETTLRFDTWPHLGLPGTVGTALKQR